MQSYSLDSLDFKSPKYIVNLPICDGYVENVRRAMRESTEKHIEVGVALIALFESRVYGVKLGANYYDLRPDNYFSFCEIRFGLDRSQVSRYMDVVYNFCRDGKIMPQYEKKTFSYLCELLPLTESEAAEAIMHCNTVAELRKYKNDLKGHNDKKSIATSQKIKPTVQNDAISRQESSFELSPLLIPPKESYSGEYEDFRGMTLKDLCDKCIRLEKELSHMIAEMKRYKMQYENELAANSACDCKSIAVLDFDAMDSENSISMGE